MARERHGVLGWIGRKVHGGEAIHTCGLQPNRSSEIPTGRCIRDSCRARGGGDRVDEESRNLISWAGVLFISSKLKVVRRAQ